MVSEPREVDQLPGQIYFETNASPSKFQATFLQRRFRLAPSRAEIVAFHAFGIGRAR
jgi:hypothetical protein